MSEEKSPIGQLLKGYVGGRQQNYENSKTDPNREIGNRDIFDLFKEIYKSKMGTDALVSSFNPSYQSKDIDPNQLIQSVMSLTQALQASRSGQTPAVSMPAPTGMPSGVKAISPMGGTMGGTQAPVSRGSNIKSIRQIA